MVVLNSTLIIYRLNNAAENATGLAFFGFNFSFLRPASPPFSHRIFQPRPQEVGSLRQAFPMKLYYLTQSVPGGGGGDVPLDDGMCRWMQSHFHDWIDYNGVAHFPIFKGKTLVFHIYG